MLLKNVIVKDDGGDWLFNQQSTSQPCPNSDVSFQYDLHCTPTNPKQVSLPCIDVTVKQLATVKANQRVNVSGTLSLGEKESKEVFMKQSKEITYVKEDCILEDETAQIMIQIWQPIINQLRNGKSYHFKNLMVKFYQGSTFLTTTTSTTFTEVEQSATTLEGPKMLANPEQKIEAQKFQFTSKLQIFTSCQVCKKRLSDTSSTSTKCQICGTRQRTDDCKREASARVCIAYGDCQLWLTAFTDSISKLLQHTGTTLQSSVEKLEEAIMDVENMRIKYDSHKNTIIDIAFTGDHIPSGCVEGDNKKDDATADGNQEKLTKDGIQSDDPQANRHQGDIPEADTDRGSIAEADTDKGGMTERGSLHDGMQETTV